VHGAVQALVVRQYKHQSLCKDSAGSFSGYINAMNTSTELAEFGARKVFGDVLTVRSKAFWAL
jgi:hypothetical protein